MLKIRSAQQGAFQAVALRNFEDDMLAHMTEFFPTHRRVFGEAHARRVIRYILDRAFRRGFLTERDACLYFTNALMLGSHFDEDMLIPWAKAILEDPAGGSASARIARVTERALAHMDRLAGQDNVRLNRALVRIRRDLDRFACEPVADFRHDMTRNLSALFPAKFECVEEDAMRRAIECSEAAARDLGLTTVRGAALYCACALILGSAFSSDPQVHRLGEAIRGGAGISPEARADLIFSAASWYLDAWLSGPERVVSHV